MYFRKSPPLTSYLLFQFFLNMHILFIFSLLLKEKMEFCRIRATHREKGPSNKTLALTKSMNMDIWVVGT